MSETPDAGAGRSGRAAACVAAALALAVAIGAASMHVGGVAHPGPGFFPALVATLLAVLSVALWRERAAPVAEVVPHSRSTLRVIAAATGIAIFGLLLEPVGYPALAMLMTTVGLRFIGKLPWALALLVSAASVGAIFLLFQAIGAPLPAGALMG